MDYKTVYVAVIWAHCLMTTAMTAPTYSGEGVTEEGDYVDGNTFQPYPGSYGTDDDGEEVINPTVRSTDSGCKCEDNGGNMGGGRGRVRKGGNSAERGTTGGPSEGGSGGPGNGEPERRGTGPPAEQGGGSYSPRSYSSYGRGDFPMKFGGEGFPMSSDFPMSYGGNRDFPMNYGGGDFPTNFGGGYGESRRDYFNPTW